MTKNIQIEMKKENKKNYYIFLTNFVFYNCFMVYIPL